MLIIKRLLKIIGWFFLLLFLLLYTAFYYFTLPKSDAKVLAKFANTTVKLTLTQETFNRFQFRQLTIQKDISKPTIVFVHGTIGSCIDFVEYMKDSTLLSKANFISYDRVGYNYKDKNNVQESIAFEAKMLQNITKNLDKSSTILVGYSYGGPIVLADTTNYKKLILLAPAVYSKVEPMPWITNLYKWKLTRWLVPDIWKEAAKEKLTHQKDLQNFETNWTQNKNQIIAIHGNDDGIVPYANSTYLKKQFPKNQFKLITIEEASHTLIWDNFEFIKQELLKQL